MGKRCYIVKSNNCSVGCWIPPPRTPPPRRPPTAPTGEVTVVTSVGATAPKPAARSAPPLTRVATANRPTPTPAVRSTQALSSPITSPNTSPTTSRKSASRSSGRYQVSVSHQSNPADAEHARIQAAIETQHPGLVARAKAALAGHSDEAAITLFATSLKAQQPNRSFRGLTDRGIVAAWFKNMEHELFSDTEEESEVIEVGDKDVKYFDAKYPGLLDRVVTAIDQTGSDQSSISDFADKLRQEYPQHDLTGTDDRELVSSWIRNLEPDKFAPRKNSNSRSNEYTTSKSSDTDKSRLVILRSSEEFHSDPARKRSSSRRTSATSDLGSITIITSSNTENQSGFTFSGDLGNFTMEANGSSTFSGLAPGNYFLTEAADDEWVLKEIGVLAGDVTVDVARREAFVSLGQHEHVICMFTHVNPGSGLRVVNNREGTYHFTISQADMHHTFPLASNEHKMIPLEPGRYTVKQQLLSGRFTRTIDDVVPVEVLAGQITVCKFKTLEASPLTSPRTSTSESPASLVRGTLSKAPSQDPLISSESESSITAAMAEPAPADDDTGVTQVEIEEGVKEVHLEVEVEHTDDEVEITMANSADFEIVQESKSEEREPDSYFQGFKKFVWG